MIGLFASRKPCTERQQRVFNALSHLFYVKHIINSDMGKLADAVVDYILNDILRLVTVAPIEATVAPIEQPPVEHISESDSNEYDKHKKYDSIDCASNDTTVAALSVAAAINPDCADYDSSNKYDKHKKYDSVVAALPNVELPVTTSTPVAAIPVMDINAWYNKVTTLIDEIIVHTIYIKNNTASTFIDSKYETFEISHKYDKFAFNELQDYLFYKSRDYSSLKHDILYEIHHAYRKLTVLYELIKPNPKPYMKKWKLSKKYAIVYTLDTVQDICQFGVGGICETFAYRHGGTTKLLTMNESEIISFIDKAIKWQKDWTTLGFRDGPVPCAP
jgi:hypothetical protein